MVYVSEDETTYDKEMLLIIFVKSYKDRICVCVCVVFIAFFLTA